MWSFPVSYIFIRLSLNALVTTQKLDKLIAAAPNIGLSVHPNTMNIEGMMCGHCEATVKKALEAVDGVTEAVVSHENGTAVVTLSKEVDNDVLKKAVEDKDYKVTAVK